MVRKISSKKRINALVINPSKALLSIFRCLFGNVYFAISRESFALLSMKKSEPMHRVLYLRLPADRLARFVLTHIMYLISLIKTAKKIDIIILSQVADYPLLTMLIGRVLGKKIIDFIGGFRIFLSWMVLRSKTTVLRKLLNLYAMISLELALKIVDRIVIISESLSQIRPFNKFSNKLRVALNFPSEDFYSVFKVKKRLNERGIVIGYIGAFTLAKGIYNLALAFKQLINYEPRLKIIFVGDWQNSEPPWLGVKVKTIFEGYDNVIFTGYVSHEKVADYLNEMLLLVLPSYSEGLPHVILEAMACGTPVLATPVGAIPNIVKEGETGFLLKSNNPKYIFNRIRELLNRPEILEKISINAHKYLKENFSFEKTLEDWRRIVDELVDSLTWRIL